MLGCTDGEDSLEHYGRCRLVWQFASKHLHIRCRFSPGWDYWTLTAPEDRETSQHTSWWPRMALLHYAVLRTAQAAHSRGRLSPEESQRALRQAAIEGARGHPLAAAWAASGPTAHYDDDHYDDDRNY